MHSHSYIAFAKTTVENDTSFGSLSKNFWITFETSGKNVSGVDFP